MGTQGDGAMEDDEENEDKSGAVDPSLLPELGEPPYFACVVSPDMNPVLAAILQQHTETLPLGVEEVRRSIASTIFYFY